MLWNGFTFCHRVLLMFYLNIDTRRQCQPRFLHWQQQTQPCQRHVAVLSGVRGTAGNQITSSPPLWIPNKTTAVSFSFSFSLCNRSISFGSGLVLLCRCRTDHQRVVAWSDPPWQTQNGERSMWWDPFLQGFIYRDGPQHSASAEELTAS